MWNNLLNIIQLDIGWKKITNLIYFEKEMFKYYVIKVEIIITRRVYTLKPSTICATYTLKCLRLEFLYL